MRAVASALALLACVAAACATIGSEGDGARDLPSSGVGPFRKLSTTEVLGVPPFVLEDRVAQYREPAALPVFPEDSSSASVYVYAVARVADADAGSAHDVIVRTRADDARSFYGTSSDSGHQPTVVLEADAAWEAARIGGPSAVRVGDQVFLYYSAGGGIGVARSFDGLTFRKEVAPVLTQGNDVPWETTQPSAPSVVVYPDGRLRMMYASGGFLGEAESNDGLTWRRIDADPSTPGIDAVLAPSAPVAPETLLPGEHPPFDTAEVADPSVALRITPAGRLHVRVLYTGYADAASTRGRNGTIGFAARYGTSGPLSRQPSPVYSVAKHEAAPTLFEWAGGSMLYVHEDKSIDSTTNVPSIAGAFAPPTMTLGTPVGYASAP